MLRETTTNWIYRIIMALLLINIGAGVYVAVTTVNPPKICINGIIMQAKGDMMVQSGLWPTHCMPIDKD